MVTPAHKGAKRRLFLREHREHKGVSAPEMADKMGMERESLLRLERKWRGCNAEKQAKYAAELGIDPEDLWRLPGPSSTDAKLDELTKTVADLANRVKKTGT